METDEKGEEHSELVSYLLFGFCSSYEFPQNSLSPTRFNTDYHSSQITWASRRMSGGEFYFYLQSLYVFFTLPCTHRCSCAALVEQKWSAVSLVASTRVWALRTASYAWNVRSPQWESKTYSWTHTCCSCTQKQQTLALTHRCKSYHPLKCVCVALWDIPAL